uniref:Uncharacterized protein n=1 Tax=Arundo donax TaxID=35708 RepID=A0A0A9B0U9_ARUDO
MELNNFLYL